MGLKEKLENAREENWFIGLSDKEIRSIVENAKAMSVDEKIKELQECFMNIKEAEND